MLVLLVVLALAVAMAVNPAALVVILPLMAVL